MEPTVGSDLAGYGSVLAAVPAEKMTRLEARLKAVPDLDSEDEEWDDPDISGSDSYSDPEYLPGREEGEDDSDSSEEEVLLTQPEWLLLLDCSRSQRLLLALLALLDTCPLPPSGPWWTLPPGLAGSPWRTWEQCFPLSWYVSSASIYNLLAVSYVI